ncbi:MAG: hypothetical protein JST00_22720 [Deltaproteobacteria bacterium]|nr:hypothetical protein [Deltaproteobacteria bacterium]
MMEDRMIRNLLTVMACAGAFALVGACSSSVEEKYPSVDSFCAAKADAECTNLAAGCGATVEACKSLRTDACKASAATAQGAGRNYKPANAEACISSVGATYSPKVVDPEKEVQTIDTCERVFAGSKAANTQCASNYECDGAQICDKTVCATKVDTAIGSACGDPGKVCSKGAFCAQQGPNKFCVAKKADGEICTPDSPCKEDLRCVGAGAGGGSCKPRVGITQKCDTDNDCATSAPYCEPSVKECRLKYQPGTKACKDLGGP